MDDKMKERLKDIAEKSAKSLMCRDWSAVREWEIYLSKLLNVLPSEERHEAYVYYRSQIKCFY